MRPRDEVAAEIRHKISVAAINLRHDHQAVATLAMLQRLLDALADGGAFPPESALVAVLDINRLIKSADADELEEEKDIIEISRLFEDLFRCYV